MKRITSVIVALSIALTHAASGQDTEQRYKTGQIKVGDRIVADPLGINRPDTCTVISTREMPDSYKRGYTESYGIRCDHKPWDSVIATDKYVKLAGQPNAVASGAAAARPPAGANRFGTREPHTCANTKAPAGTRIDAAHAREYLLCQAEGVKGDFLYLVENLTLEVGAPDPMAVRERFGFSEIDMRVTPIAIRGSFQSYQCKPLDAQFDSRFYNLGKNCNVYDNRHAAGYCYKNTWGDWKCSMTDLNVNGDDRHFQVPPPSMR